MIGRLLLGGDLGQRSCRYRSLQRRGIAPRSPPPPWTSCAEAWNSPSGVDDILAAASSRFRLGLLREWRRCLGRQQSTCFTSTIDHLHAPRIGVPVEDLLQLGVSAAPFLLSRSSSSTCPSTARRVVCASCEVRVVVLLDFDHGSPPGRSRGSRHRVDLDRDVVARDESWGGTVVDHRRLLLFPASIHQRVRARRECCGWVALAGRAKGPGTSRFRLLSHRSE